MRIAHVTSTFPPYYAGTGMVCYHTALELARRGHDVTVFTAMYPPNDFEYPPEFGVVRLPSLFRIGNAPFLPGLLKIKDFDLIHLHYPFIFGAELVWLSSRFQAIPYVVTHHNDLIGDGFRQIMFAAYSEVSSRITFNKAAKILVVSRDHAAHCRATPLLKERWEAVVEVPNGVDPHLFNPGVNGSTTRARLGIDPEARVVLFVGALDRAHHFKGLDHLLRAFSRPGTPEPILLIVGEGGLKPRYAALAEELGIAKRTIFAGAVPHDQLPRYYAAADLVVLPSVPPESFGMVLIEAMACARPVIAQDIPGVRSIVDHGKDGLLSFNGDVDNLAQKIRGLLDDPERREAMGCAGLEKVRQKYTWPRVVDRLEQAYQQVLEETAAERLRRLA